MNRTDFLRMIENRAPVDRRMIGEINDLINIFPYFQSAHLLLLKGLQLTADVKFENQLKNSAIHVGDREVLYYLLKIDPVSSTDDNPLREQEVLTSETPSGDSQQTVIESARNSQDLINEFEKYGDDNKTEEQKEIIDPIFSRSILISTESENDESESTVFVIDDEQEAVEEKIFYMDPGFSVSDRPDLLELDLVDNIQSEAGDEAETQIKPENEEKNLKKQEQTDLIEKFILANPRIEPNREKSDLPVEDLSKPDAEGKGEFITETLARIYFNQGYYSKAIDIYEKLCLKFPEKSSYFAAQIGKIKEVIK